MSDEEQQNHWIVWLQKQGIVTVLLVGVLWFFRQDVWLPVRNALENQTSILDKIADTQVQIRDEQRRGVWRSVEPPSPAELPKGVPVAKDE